MMKSYAPFIREATLRVTMTLQSEGHGGDPSPKLQGEEYIYMPPELSLLFIQLLGSQLFVYFV
jgi:hypothetical protein